MQLRLDGAMQPGGKASFRRLASTASRGSGELLGNAHQAGGRLGEGDAYSQVAAQ